MKKLIISLLVFAFAFVPVITLAQIPSDYGDPGGSINLPGPSNDDPKVIIADIINWVLGFLALIAIIIILIGGFEWMTAGGNEEKVTEAKKLLLAGVIGLVIILSAYAITNFVLAQLISATNAG